jgi:hypothetical protein
MEYEMILFANDWAYYPTAIPDFETTNISWVRLARVFRKMGVKNHVFHLALVNQELKGVNPHDPFLSDDLRVKIGIECYINPWYFFREVARAPGSNGSPAQMIEANRGNIALFWCFFNHVTIFLIQIRQTGKSFNVDLLMQYLLNILCENTKINLLTKDDVLRRKNIERLKEIAEEFPLYLQQKTREDANNGEEITVVARGNSYTTHVPQSSIKRALNMGRGLTSAIFHIDEGPFQVNIRHALPAALAATGAAIPAAKLSGSPYGTILTTTAGKKDDEDGKFIYELLMEATVWSERLYDATDAEDLERLVRGSNPKRTFTINATFDHRMLGKTDKWLMDTIQQSFQSGDAADRDYFNRWTSGSQTNPLPTAVLEAIAQSAREPNHTSISSPGGFIMRWYVDEDQLEDYMANNKFVAGIDTSNGGGNDAITIVIKDISTLAVVGVGVFGHTNIIVFCEWVSRFLQKYVNITAVIENRSSGTSLIDYLLLMLPGLGIDPFKRLFNTVVNESVAQPDRFREINKPMGRRENSVYERFKKCFGFTTSGSGMFSRSDLYSTTLQNAAKRAGEKVYDKTLAAEIAGLINNKGRIDHAPNEHDDTVISWLLGSWLITMGKNLTFYGIDSREIGAGLVKIDNISLADQQRMAEQDALRRRMQDVYDRLTDENDEFLSMKLEQELRVLDSRVVMQEGETYSIDDLVRKARESKRNRRRPSTTPIDGDTYAQAFVPSMVNQYQYAHPIMSDRPLSMRDLRYM